MDRANTTYLQEGNTVLVFGDPIAKTDLEGKATLIESFIKHMDMEFWMVSFWANPEAVCFRWIASNG